MTQPDHVRRFLFDHTDIRGEIATLHQSFATAFANQQCPAQLKPLFGEFLAGASLLSEVLKFEGTLTLQARGDGPLPLIMAEVDHLGHLRGVVQCRDDITQNLATLSDLNLNNVLGSGVLAITIDPDQGQRYQGLVPLDGANLSECLSRYFEQSEQLPTYIQLFADHDDCGGLFLQCLPAQLVTDPHARDDHWQTAKQLAATTSANELFQLPDTDVLYRLFNELSCRIFEPKAIQFHCRCSKESSANAISALGKDDAYALLKEANPVMSHCQFCGQQYAFTEKDIDTIFGDSNCSH